jgi:hypothetical protein
MTGVYSILGFVAQLIASSGQFRIGNQKLSEIRSRQTDRNQIRGIMHYSDGHKATASTANAGKDGAPEIEITDEMIEAGVEALLSDYFLSEEWEGRFRAPAIVRDVLVAALRVRTSAASHGASVGQPDLASE